MFYIYMLDCGVGFYTGQTETLAQRLTEHKRGKGSLYTKINHPQLLVFVERVGTRGEAVRLEQKIKHMSRMEKLKLIEQFAKATSNYPLLLKLKTWRNEE